MLLEAAGVCIDKNTLERVIFYLVEILHLNKIINKKIITKNNKSQVFLKLNEFNYQYSVNYQISYHAPHYFKFKNILYKIERSLYSITPAIRTNTPLQVEPTINLDALFVEDSIKYKINQDYLNIAKQVIINRLKNNNKTLAEVLNQTYLKKSYLNLKTANKQIMLESRGVALPIKNTRHLSYPKQKLRKLASQFSLDMAEFELATLIHYLEHTVASSNIYFIFFLDFRGRMYSVGVFGPVLNKIIRSILEYDTCHDVDNPQIFNENL